MPDRDAKAAGPVTKRPRTPFSYTGKGEIVRRKRSMTFLVLFVMIAAGSAALFTGCGSGSSSGSKGGTATESGSVYFSQKNHSDFIALKDNHQFSMSENKKQSYGSYEIVGDQLRLYGGNISTAGKTFTETLTIKGNVLTAKDGVKWVKRF